MQAFKASQRRFEDWLKEQVGDELVEPDLRRKHRKMRDSSFAFLRATYWRWAETVFAVCPELAAAPEVLAIGDTHLENFGTWRDVEGRLIWGANDFDDAAVMPYALDLVRLATSALLARSESRPQKTLPSTRAICRAILAGYDEGIARPAPVVLERDHPLLRRALLLTGAGRREFWAGFEKLRKTPARPKERFARALRGALPQGCSGEVVSRRSAGTGSLGRPRFVAQAEWLGGPLLREAKALLPSAWTLSHPGDAGLKVEAIATGRARAPDPHYRVVDGILVRRLSPNSRKIEAAKDPAALLAPGMLTLMGRELGNCHADDAARAAAIRRDLKARDRDWLAAAARAAAAFVASEQRGFAGR